MNSPGYQKHSCAASALCLSLLIAGGLTTSLAGVAADVNVRLASAAPARVATTGSTSTAAASGRPPVASSMPARSAELQDSVPLPSDSAEHLIYLKDVITPSANELADMTQITPLLNRLQKEQRAGKLWVVKSHRVDNTELKSLDTNSSQAKSPQDSTGVDSAASSSSDIGRILANQRLMYLRIKINSYLQTNTLEVASVIGRLNSGLAELADRKAMISDERARTLRRQSFINFISGGLTKIGGYSIALTPSTLIPTNVLEIFDGGVQTSLSLFTLKQQKEEQKLTKTRPVILNAFLSGNNITAQEFPSTVWSYLNTVPPRNKLSKTRRQELIDHWVDIGRLSDGRKRPNRPRSTGFTPAFNQSFHLDDLDDTVAMMSDLKSVVSGMESGLMELSQSIRGSYGDDPEI